MTFLSAKNVTKFGTKLFTKLSENFGDSTNFSTKMSPKLVKIGWNHQNLRKFCRKSRWAHIWNLGSLAASTARWAWVRLCSCRRLSWVKKVFTYFKRTDNPKSLLDVSKDGFRYSCGNKQPVWVLPLQRIGNQGWLHHQGEDRALPEMSPAQGDQIGLFGQYSFWLVVFFLLVVF